MFFKCKQYLHNIEEKTKTAATAHVIEKIDTKMKNVH